MLGWCILGDFPDEQGTVSWAVVHCLDCRKIFAFLLNQYFKYVCNTGIAENITLGLALLYPAALFNRPFAP